jgi:hypothetical protein
LSIADLLHFVKQHQVSLTYVGMAVLSLMASSLDPPDAHSGHAYRWLYKFANGIAANADKFAHVPVETQVPNAQNMGVNAPVNKDTGIALPVGITVTDKRP